MWAKRAGKEKMKIPINDNPINIRDDIIQHMDAKFDELSGKIDKGFKSLGDVMVKGFEVMQSEFKDMKEILVFIAKKYGYEENIPKEDVKKEKSKSFSNKRGENNSLVNYYDENSVKNNSLSLSEKNQIQDNNNNKISNLFDKEKSLNEKKEEVPSSDEKNSKKSFENPKSSVKNKLEKKMEDIIESKEIIKKKQIEMKKEEINKKKKEKFQCDYKA